MFKGWVYLWVDECYLFKGDLYFCGWSLIKSDISTLSTIFLFYKMEKTRYIFLFYQFKNNLSAIPLPICFFIKFTSFSNFTNYLSTAILNNLFYRFIDLLITKYVFSTNPKSVTNCILYAEQNLPSVKKAAKRSIGKPWWASLSATSSLKKASLYRLRG